MNPFCETTSFPLLPSCLFTGTVGTVTGQEIDLGGSAGAEILQTILVAPTSYYVEVMAGDNEGQRFDIISVTGNVLTLANATTAELTSGDAPYNTLAGATPVSLAGDVIVIRAHRTLAELFPIDNPATPDVDGFLAGSDSSQSGRVLFFDSASGQLVPYYLFDDGGEGEWTLAADGLTSANDKIVPPCAGVFTHNLAATPGQPNDPAAAFDTFRFGEVRTNDAVCPMDRGYNLVGAAYPVDQSADDRAMTKATGFDANFARSGADQVQFWRDDSNTDGVPHLCYDPMFLLEARGTAAQWTASGDNTRTDLSALDLFFHDRAAMYCNQINSKLDFTIPTPVIVNTVNP